MRIPSPSWSFVYLLLALHSFGADFTQGTLRRVNREGRQSADCPLKHTAVTAEISGMLARVTVVQEFQNSFPETIEAIYVFPLPHGAAVDRMTMLVGGRTIRGVVKRREEARALYEAARGSGRTAGLLEQERPNVFTQSVANIPPGDTISVNISYVEVLDYRNDGYEFAFPMVVGPRYMSTSVTDPTRIAPPVTPEGTRAGHDISIEIALDAGQPVNEIASPTHPVDVNWQSAMRALVKLKDEKTIPNKDFVLRYKTAGRSIQSALLAHRSGRGGFFGLFLEPPEAVSEPDVTPKELIFVLDTSGSMSGFPIEKAKEAMRLALDGLYQHDTFNLITFSGDTDILFPEPVQATAENLRIAQLFLQSRTGGGGTEMMKAIRAALAPSGASGRVRIVCFMTDGLVGQDLEILSEIQKHPEARVFAFGIGQSVNRFLLDGMAKQGRGEVEYVSLTDDGSAAAARFHQRVRSPLLTDIAIDWGSLPVSMVFPASVPDLFDAKPLVIMGRYAGPAHGVIRLKGRAGGREIAREIAVSFPAAEDRHDVLGSIWARMRISDLMRQDFAGVQRGAVREDLAREITQLGLDHQLMTQFTSFVAVEERVVAQQGRPMRVEVPVEMPEGVSYEGILGPAYRRTSGGGGNSGGVVGGIAGGSGGGVGGGVFMPMSIPKAVAPPPAPEVKASPNPAIRVAPRQFDAGRLMESSQSTSVSALVLRKLDPKLITALASSDQASKVEVQILVRETSAAALEELRRAGLEDLKPAGSGLQVSGRIAIANLKDLAGLSNVRYVVPRTTR